MISCKPPADAASTFTIKAKYVFTFAQVEKFMWYFNFYLNTFLSVLYQKCLSASSTTGLGGAGLAVNHTSGTLWS